MTISRRDLLTAGVASVGAGACRLAVGAERPSTPVGSFRFVHLTDMHVQPERGAAKGFQACLRRIETLDPAPDFVITGGDLIMDALYPSRERIDLEWRLFDESMKDFGIQAYHTIGNHDVAGWAAKSQLDRNDPGFGKAIFAEKYGDGKTYRSFDHKGWHFVILDSIGISPGGSGYKGFVDERQIEWLKADLQKVGKQRPVVIVTHIPFLSAMPQLQSGSTHPVSPGALVTNYHTFQHWMQDFNVRLVLSGHGHMQERIELLGTTHIQSGAVSGRWWKGHLYGQDEAFGVIDCNADRFAYEFHGFGWNAEKWQ